MKTCFAFVVALISLVSLPANAVIFGAPSDDLVGCDLFLPGSCHVFIDELGNASASMTSGFGGVDLHAVITHVASESFTDASGNPLEVTTYTLTWDSYGLFGPGTTTTGIFPGAVGLCEFGATADGASCLDASGNPTAAGLSDVLVFRDNGDGTNTINLLSDDDALFAYATGFNIAEVGPEGHNGALYHALGPSGGGEDMFYHVTSDVPEPASLALLGLGLAGLGFSRRKQ